MFGYYVKMAFWDKGIFAMNKKVKRAMDYWNRMAESINDEVAAIDRTTDGLQKDAAYVDRFLPLRRDSNILDLCCGNGLIALSISEKVYRVTGVDGAESMVKMFKRLIKGKNIKNIDVLIGEAWSLPFQDDLFDGVLCFDAFHYFPDHEYAKDVLTEILRVAKPTATILLTKIPSMDSLGYRIWSLIRSRHNGYDAPVPAKRGKRGALERVALLLRRLTGKKVDSDDWLWYEKYFFESFKGGKFRKVKIFPSPSRGRLNYRFDVLITN